MGVTFRSAFTAGFGDFEVAHVSHPKITTVSIDAQALGQRPTRAVLDALAERSTPENLRDLVLPIQIIIRESA